MKKIGLFSMLIILSGCTWLFEPYQLKKPQDISASDGTKTDYVRIEWSEVINAEYYEIYQAESEDGDYILIGNTESPPYDDISISARMGQAHYYKVSASSYTGDEKSRLSESDRGYCLVPQDDYEPNNSIADAQYITSDTSYQATIHSSSDIDYYEIWISTSPGNLYYDLWSIPIGCDYDIELLNSSGNVLTGSYTRGDNSEWGNYSISSTGTYYIRIISYSGSHPVDTYSLEYGY